MTLDLSFLPAVLRDTTVPKPLSGTLSGHAAGEPFSQHVHAQVLAHYPTQTYQQFDFLNRLYLDNPTVTVAEDRFALIPDPALAYLLARGKEVTRSWTPDNLFVEKQDDTADILVIEDDFTNILDVKSRHMARLGQPPNIISAYKLAKAARHIVEGHSKTNLAVFYIGMDWVEEETVLRCVDVHLANLFKTNPEELYINFSAALQLQFHVAGLDQSYRGTIKEWCRDYLRAYSKKAQAREVTFRSRFIEPFAQY